MKYLHNPLAICSRVVPLENLFRHRYSRLCELLPWPCSWTSHGPPPSPPAPPPRPAAAHARPRRPTQRRPLRPGAAAAAFNYITKRTRDSLIHVLHHEHGFPLRDYTYLPMGVSVRVGFAISVERVHRNRERGVDRRRRALATRAIHIHGRGVRPTS